MSYWRLKQKKTELGLCIFFIGYFFPKNITVVEKNIETFKTKCIPTAVTLKKKKKQNQMYQNWQ